MSKFAENRLNQSVLSLFHANSELSGAWQFDAMNNPAACRRVSKNLPSLEGRGVRGR